MQDALWWQRGIVYQVYPRSFQDSDSDGVGDLEGIRRRLDHLVWLGVDALWISPIFVSPMADFGYDVADYCAIEPMFGSLEDFDRLISEAHAKGLKVILDFVPNHTSEQHTWFSESRSSRDNPKRDWYIWRDRAPDGGPPNNWISNFGGSAWQWDEATGQYYYHAFLVQQPDLNWRNPDVRAAMYEVLRFWLDRGVDGFRVDVIWHLIKDADFRDNPDNPGYQPTHPMIGRFQQTYSADRPEVHDVVREMRAVLDDYDERVLIGEIYLPVERVVTYYGEGLSGAHLPFNFQLLETPWDARLLAGMIERYEGLLPLDGWPNWVLGNHDRQRIAGRVGEEQARVAALLLLTLRGTPTVYYGDELGLPDVAIPPERIQDPWGINEPGLGLGRDPVRTPMQWSRKNFAGFSATEPWLPLSPDWAERNVETLRCDPHSILNLYRELILLRRAHPALAIGGFRAIEREGDVLAYEREADGECLLVILNLGHQERAEILPQGDFTILLSTYLDRTGAVVGTVTLRPSEGLVLAA